MPDWKVDGTTSLFILFLFVLLLYDVVASFEIYVMLLLKIDLSLKLIGHMLYGLQ